MSSACPSQSATGSGQMFTSLIQLLIAAQCNISRPDMWPEDATHKLLPEYDFIVVGAGSAGCVVASRLSEVAHWNVLLVEAGGDPPVMSEVPRLDGSLIDSQYDWQYLAEPSIKHGLSLVNRSSKWTRGKLLGGCSAHNGMVYTRGNRKDYDDWESLGNYGWGYDNVLNYFKKSEDLLVPSLVESDKGRYHGVGGELKVDNFLYSSPMDYYVRAIKEMGYDFIDDINGAQNIGFTEQQVNVDGATRCSSAKAFLSKKKNNLHVVKNTLVTKILINQMSKKSVGVEFISNSLEKFRVKAIKEVIVSGGTVNTPQLLMLSGVGPAEELKRHDIPLISDLSVGQNVHDHIQLPMFIKLPRNRDLSSIQDADLNLYLYLRHKSGPLTGTRNIGGFINTNNHSSPFPNLQIINIRFHKQDPNTIRSFLGQTALNDEIIQSIIRHNEESGILMVVLVLLNPKSRGEIKLRSRNPFDKPLIFPNYLDKDEDVETLVQGARFVNAFIKTKAMQQEGAQLIAPDIKNCQKFIFNTNDYWRCAIRNIGASSMHLAGSAKMGPVKDLTAVVDPELKVYGVRGLRVADASVMPRVTSGNTNAPTVMIGEKAADFIKNDWLYSVY